MAVPFDIESGVAPGVSVASIDGHGNMVVAGTLTVAGQLVTPGGGSTPATPTPVISGMGRALGLVAETFELAAQEQTYTLAAGNLNAIIIYLPGLPIGHLGGWFTTAGSGPTGYNGFALYTSAGVLVDKTVDMSSLWPFADATFQSGALTGGSQTPAAGAYYLANLTNLTVNPRLGGAAINNLPTINSIRPSVFLTGQATFPSSFNPAAASINSGFYYMAAY